MANKNQGRSRFPLPTVINPVNRRCVTFNIPDDLIHIGNFWGAIQKLAQTGAYSNDAAHTAKEVASVWFQVIDDARQRWLAEECGGAIEPGDCHDHDTASGVLTYAPQNPFTQATYIPQGYANPPMYVVQDSDLLLHSLGFQTGDISTSILNFPLGSLPTVIPPDGLPRFRITFNGNDDPAGVTVEIHLVKIPLGGFALVTVDGNPITPPPEMVNLNRDELSIPPETSAIIVIEKQVIGTGQHFLDVTFTPRVNDEAPFVYFGGGLHKVVLCGEDLSTPVPQMTFENCKIRFRPSAISAWQEFDISQCVQGIVDTTIEERLEDGTLGGSQRGPDGETGVGFCKTYHVTLDGNGRWIAPIPIRANYTIQISNARGGATDGTVGWYCPEGTDYLLGSCVPGSGLLNPADPLPTVKHMRLIMKYNGTYRDAYNLTHTVSSSLVGAHDLELQVNDSVLSDNAGNYQFDIQICNYGACVPVAMVPPEDSSSTFENGIFTATTLQPREESNGAYQVFYDIGDQNNNPCACRKIEIISLTGYTLPNEETPYNGGAVYVCDGTVIVNEHGIGQNWQTFYEGLSPANQCIFQFDMKSVTPFTIQFRVVEC